MKNKMDVISRLLMVIAAAALIVVLFIPLWRIELNAPQYPEGLKLEIHANALKGNVDIINGLNHYIGMKTLHKEDFTEFTVLPYIIIFFAAAFLLVAILGRYKWLTIVFSLFVIFGIVAMVDFWRWEYNYGHNLDPNAAIIVPGMAYQPPLIGFKQLLNFGAFSTPDMGGWLFIGVGLLALVVMLIGWTKGRKLKKRRPAMLILLLVGMLPFLQSCSTKPEPIKAGVDHCDFCKMTVTDVRFSSELITKKGKIYKFDDIHCLLSYLKSDSTIGQQASGIYLVNFSNGSELLKADNALLLQSEAFKSPMNGNTAAFGNADELKKVQDQYPGKTASWKEIYP